jgi:hypothetical protein
MRDLSFAEALDDPDLPFRKFVAACVDLWNLASTAYELAGSSFGPADQNENVAGWVMHRLDIADHLSAAEEILGLGECSD